MARGLLVQSWALRGQGSQGGTDVKFSMFWALVFTMLVIQERYDDVYRLEQTILRFPRMREYSKRGFSWSLSARSFILYVAFSQRVSLQVVFSQGFSFAFPRSCRASFNPNM